MAYEEQWADGSVADSNPLAGAELWPPGNYDGTFLRHECGASAVKGTNYIRLYFDVNGEPKQVDVWITDASFDMAKQRLEKVGWNGEYPESEFSIGDAPVKLYCKHELYKGKLKERWDISTFEAKPADNNVMSRFAARFKSATVAPAAAPAAPPKAPPAGKAPAAQGKPSSAPARPAAATKPGKAPAKPAPKAGDQDSAWAVWAENKAADPVAFYKAVDAERGETEIEDMTAEQWGRVAAACPPF